MSYHAPAAPRAFFALVVKWISQQASDLFL